MKQKKVTLKDHGLEIEYELPGYKILHYERLTKQKLYFSKIQNPDNWGDEKAHGESDN